MRDDLLRDALARATGSEPPVGDAWARFQSRRRRAALWRNLTVAATTAVAVAALVTTLPGLNPRGADFLGPSDGSPPATETWVRYTDPVAGFELLHPPTWLVRATPGERAAVFPPGSGDPDGPLSSTEEQDGDGPALERATRFFVEIIATPPTPSCVERNAGEPTAGCTIFDWSREVREEADAQRAWGATVEEHQTTVGGVDAHVFSYAFPETPRAPEDGWRTRYPHQDAPGYWCPNCRATRHLVQWLEGWRIELRVVAPDQASHDAHVATAKRIVGSFAGIAGEAG